MNGPTTGGGVRYSQLGSTATKRPVGSNDELVHVGDVYMDSDDNLASARLHAAEYAEAAEADERPLQYLVVRTETLAAYAGRADPAPDAG